jgi:hypothetical protein
MAKRRLPKAVLEALQRLGREGGLARARNLTAAQRRAGAQKAAAARWKTRRAG